MKPIAIIGGSGLENPDILFNAREERFNTPYGDALYTSGKISDKDVILISRHGKKHTISPTHVNNRANIWLLKELGCSGIIATTACGSLREEIHRGSFVVPDQFIDMTRHRPTTFFDTFKPGEMHHTPMADPFDNMIRKLLMDSCENFDIEYHTKGTIVTIEGPRFSTRAESNMFRLWGADIINMSTAPEAILANEAGLPYAPIAMATDYDCWKTDEEPVTWQAVVEILKKNTENMIKILTTAVADF
ncbi:S-methyl-5'-thioadenosine phosphorylase [Saccharicrinis sp. FJH62]|uniref:S-methyl-5'-thioadenosine phosphorylase n=1 Tax=Saccharicrinis sp. FJH62 TaxID=3344657 RepID=UPI0035D3F678